MHRCLLQAPPHPVLKKNSDRELWPRVATFSLVSLGGLSETQ